ncbi:unnamed protein product [Amoebophrya sp. A25]|nr:unnamed protein product [Amoebophrya sp. A25]|eukprot:GSA25T00019334001.1
MASPAARPVSPEEVTAPELTKDLEGHYLQVPYEVRISNAIRSFFGYGPDKTDPSHPNWLAKNLIRQEIMKSGGEKAQGPIGPDGKPVIDPLIETQLKRIKRRRRNAYFFGVFWFLTFTGALIFTGLQYLNTVLPTARDTFLQSTAGPAVARRFENFLDESIFSPLRMLNNVVQRGFWRPYPSMHAHVSPIDFKLFEALVGPTITARRSIFRLEVGFQGTRLDTNYASLRFARIGPKEHVVLQSDLHPFCREIGMFGCVKNMTLHFNQWFKRMQQQDLAQIVTQTRLAPTHLNPFEGAAQVVSMPPFCDVRTSITTTTTTTLAAASSSSNDHNNTSSATSNSTSSPSVAPFTTAAPPGYAELGGPVEVGDGRTFELLEKELFYLRSYPNCSARSSMPFSTWLQGNLTAEYNTAYVTYIQTELGKQAAAAANASAQNAAGTGGASSSSTPSTGSSSGGQSLLEILNLTAIDARDRHAPPAQSECIGPGYVYDGPRLSAAEIHQRTTERKYFLINQPIQEQVYGEFDQDPAASFVETESRIFTETMLHPSLGYSTPVIPLYFKMEIPDYLDAEQNLMLATMGSINFLIGRLTVELTQFAPYLLEKWNGGEIIFGSQGYKAYIVNAQGLVVCAAYLSEMLEPIPLDSRYPIPGAQEGAPGMGAILQGELPPAQLQYRNIKSIDSHFSEISPDTLANADGKEEGVLLDDGVLIRALSTKDPLLTSGDIAKGRFYAVIWADYFAFADTWTVISSYIKIVLGGWPFFLFIMVTVLYAIREVGVRNKGELRETALFAAKLHVLGPAEVEKDRQKGAVDAVQKDSR